MAIPFQLPFGKHRSVDVLFTEPSLTQAHMQDECDINNIMARYYESGLIDHVNTHEGKYGNFIDSIDYQLAMNQVIEAKEAFMSLPSSLRDQFGNDPAKFLDFVQNPANKSEMEKLGLLPSHAEDLSPTPVTPLDVTGVGDTTEPKT